MLKFSNKDIFEITKEGMTLKNRKDEVFISFSECRRNYALENSLVESNCVATRDINIPMFIFYSMPRVEVHFKKKIMCFTKRSIHNKFYELQKKLNTLGYATYDLS